MKPDSPPLRKKWQIPYITLLGLIAFWLVYDKLSWTDLDRESMIMLISALAFNVVYTQVNIITKKSSVLSINLGLFLVLISNATVVVIYSILMNLHSTINFSSKDRLKKFAYNTSTIIMTSMIFNMIYFKFADNTTLFSYFNFIVYIIAFLVYSLLNRVFLAFVILSESNYPIFKVMFTTAPSLDHYVAYLVMHFTAYELYSNGYRIGTLLVYLLYFFVVSRLKKASVTDLKLEELNLKYKHLFHSSPNAICSIDQDGTLITWNAKMESYLQLSPANVGGKIDTIFEPKIVALFHRALLEQVEVSDMDVDFPDNKIGQVIISPLKDDLDDTIGALLTCLDLTEFRRMQADLVQSEKLSVIGHLAAGMAHEIRNPLTTVRGFIQFFNELEDRKMLKTYSKLIIDEIDRMNLIISDFLLLAKPTAVKKAHIRLEEEIDRMLPILGHQALLKKVELDIQLKETVPLYVDLNAMKQVVLNLIRNAFDAMPDGGKLTIQTYLSEDAVAVSIQDNGVGIAEEHLDKLGMPFYSTKDSGTGLGLMVCYNVIEQHGGKVNLHTKEGVGTTVTLMLPIAAA